MYSSKSDIIEATQMKQLLILVLNVSLMLCATAVAQEGEWEAVTGKENLRNNMSGKILERSLPGGETARGEYHADGSGVVHEYGGSFPRTWSIKGDDQICITVDDADQCYQIEKNTTTPDLFRAREMTSGRTAEFRSTRGGDAVTTGKPSEVGNEGGAATASAAEVAAELANPNTPLATLNTKFQVRGFEGDLPNANGQNSTTLLLQPSLPFPLANGDSILFRPAIPVLFDNPSFNASDLDFDGVSGLGDIAFDLAYARTTDAGLIMAAGIISSLPTATDDGLGSRRFTLGPEFMIGKLSKKYVLGIFPNHQWDIGGSGDADISLTSIQAFGTYLPGGGWNVGSSPIMSYDHISDQWTIPLNLSFGKTVVMGGRPWKFGVEINYYVENADAFGPEWMVGFTVGPVVKNVMANWFK